MTRLAAALTSAIVVVGMALGAGWASARSTPVAAAAAAVGATTVRPSGAAGVPALFDDAVVHDVSITVDASSWLTALGCQSGGGGRPGATPVPKVDVRAVLEVDGTRLTDVGVRCKGNSSLNIMGTKKPINITTDAFVDGQDLWGFDVINLNNGWSDPSQIREALALRMFREYLPSSRVSFARVTMQGKYLGLYTMVEQINGEFADYWFRGDNGMIIKGDSPIRIAFNSSGLTWRGESLATYKSNYEVKGRHATGDGGYEELRELIRALDAPVSAGGLSDADFPAGIRQALDVESALWYVATSNLIANFDSYYVGKNFYLYRGQRDPRFHMVPWDLGLSFGLFGLQSGQGGPGGGSGVPAARVDPFAQETESGRPLIRRLLAVPAYRADYLAHYRACYEEVFTPTWIEAVGQGYQDLIRTAVTDEAAAQGRVAGSFTVAQFAANLREAVTSAAGGPGPGGPGGGSAPGILSLVAERRAFLGTLAGLRSPDVRLVSRSHQPVDVTIADAAQVRATFAGSDEITSAELRYRVDGGFENIVAMTRDASGAWLGTIPPQRQGATVSYVLRLGVADGRAVFFPTATLTKPFTYDVAGITLPRVATGGLVINEIMADNSVTIADETGDYDDWVELHNRAAVPIDLSGYFLSDRSDDPWAFALPGVVVDPGGHYLVWCDNEVSQGARHAPFRLTSAGEDVFLSTREATVDAVTFGALAPDQSYMRVADGAADWITCDRATPNRANVCDPAGARTPSAPAPPAVTPTALPSTATPSATAPPAWLGRVLWVPFAARPFVRRRTSLAQLAEVVPEALGDVWRPRRSAEELIER